jgi:tetratricopeptide (TPR) repeat protein
VRDWGFDSACLDIAYYEEKPSVAKDYYLKALALDPNDFQVNNSLTVLYLDLEDTYPAYVDYAAALRHAQKAYDVDKSEITKQNLATAHFFNENYSQTISLLSNTNFTQHPYAALSLGLAYAATEDKANARLYLQKAVDAGIEVPPEVTEFLSTY